MNKTDLVSEVAKVVNEKKVSNDTVDRIFSCIQNSLTAGESVALKGFGTFKVVIRKARKGINPRTGEMMEIGEKKVVKFTPAKTFKEAVNS